MDILHAAVPLCKDVSVEYSSGQIQHALQVAVQTGPSCSAAGGQGG